MIDYKALKDLSVKNPLVIESKDGLFTCQTDGQYVHSFYSPAKEAQRLVDPIVSLDKESTLVIVLGAGLGYHIEILERASRLDPANVSIQLDLGRAYGLRYNYSEAERCLEKAVRVAGRKVEALTGP